VDYTADFIYLVDIFVRAHEGFLEQGKLYVDPGVEAGGLTGGLAEYLPSCMAGCLAGGLVGG
jgi:hypothetical protein